MATSPLVLPLSDFREELTVKIISDIHGVPVDREMSNQGSTDRFHKRDALHHARSLAHTMQLNAVETGLFAALRLIVEQSEGRKIDSEAPSADGTVLDVVD